MNENILKYVRLDNDVRLLESASVEVHDKLPLSTYNLMYDENRNQFFLKDIGSIGDIPKKVYGDLGSKTERIIETFKYRSPANTGIMLSGVKGAGKTLLTKLISVRAAKEGLPTILVNSAYNPDKLAQFIKQVNMPCVIVFDEFDKTYDATIQGDNGEEIAVNAQAPLLSLLDGVYASNKLFVFSLNELEAVNDYLLHRPGRVFYHYRFTTLDAETVAAVCEDRLVDKKYTKDIVMLSYLIQRFTFDILNAVIDECNHYGESPLKFIDTMNVGIGFFGNYKFELLDEKTGTVLGSDMRYITDDNDRSNSMNIYLDNSLYADQWFNDNSTPSAYEAGEKQWEKDAMELFRGKRLHKVFNNLVPAAAGGDRALISSYGHLGVRMLGATVGGDQATIHGSLDNYIRAYIPGSATMGASMWSIVKRVEHNGDIVTHPLFGDNVVLRISKVQVQAYSADEFDGEFDWYDGRDEAPRRSGAKGRRSGGLVLPPRRGRVARRIQQEEQSE